MAIEENGNQKLSNDLNLALSLPESELDKSNDLKTGYSMTEDTWELIVRHNGDILPIVEELGGYMAELSGGFAIVTLPARNVSLLSMYEQIIYIEKPHKMVLDVVMGARKSCVPALYANYGLTGKGCLLAVIDSGIDWNNAAFKKLDGTTRIAWLWDQSLNLASSGKMPPNGYYNGSEFSGEEIDMALAGDEELLAMLRRSVDYSGHGTFVAGIAAGNDETYRGIAYEATLIIVKLGDEPRTSRLMEGVNYCIDKAAQMGMPLAINLSFGTNQGSHDGTDLLSAYLDWAAGTWKTVICCGTGNEAGAGNHAGGTLTMGQNVYQEFSVGQFQTGIWLQFWKNYVDSMKISMITPSGMMLGPFVQGTDMMYKSDGTRLFVYYGEPSPFSRYQQIYFDLIPTANYIQAGAWIIMIEPERIIDGRYDIWMPEAVTLNRDTKFLRPDEDITLTVPSASDKVISVGAYDSGRDAYADFSGRGYTRTGVMIKPDIVAPGVGITSIAAYGGTTVRSGTSMATPFVTGSAALMMQWGIVNGNDPFLYGEKVKAMLIKSARQLPGESVPSRRTGWGALCARV